MPPGRIIRCSCRVGCLQVTPEWGLSAVGGGSEMWTHHPRRTKARRAVFRVGPCFWHESGRPDSSRYARWSHGTPARSPMSGGPLGSNRRRPEPHGHARGSQSVESRELSRNSGIRTLNLVSPSTGFHTACKLQVHTPVNEPASIQRPHTRNGPHGVPPFDLLVGDRCRRVVQNTAISGAVRFSLPTGFRYPQRPLHPCLLLRHP